MSSFQEQELEAIKKELNILKKNIEYENKQQKILVEYFCYQIMEYLYECNNIKKTAEYFGCDIKYLYSKLDTWPECSDTLIEREDYNDYHYKFEGRRCEIDDIMFSENYNEKIRTPDNEELEIIFAEYKSGKITLYELADKYNLIIINLFRLLKEHKLIVKESDAIGYDKFYKEYIGEYEYNKYIIDRELRLVDNYYYHLEKYKSQDI
jgi:hypothetical protein